MLRELNQECEDTFEIKDGNVTDINITGVALMPRFRDNDGVILNNLYIQYK